MEGTKKIGFIHDLLRRGRRIRGMNNFPYIQNMSRSLEISPTSKTQQAHLKIAKRYVFSAPSGFRVLLKAKGAKERRSTATKA